MKSNLEWVEEWPPRNSYVPHTLRAGGKVVILIFNSLKQSKERWLVLRTECCVCVCAK